MSSSRNGVIGVRHPTYPTSDISNTAHIRGIPLHYSDDDITPYLKDQGILRARRRRRRNDADPSNPIPTVEILLSFEPNTEPPHWVDLGFWKPKLRERITPPPRCLCFQRFEHVSKLCSRPAARCSLCSGLYEWCLCPNRTELLLGNCKSHHGAFDRLCPFRESALPKKNIFFFWVDSTVRTSASSSPRLH